MMKAACLLLAALVACALAQPDGVPEGKPLEFAECVPFF
jgi:hypothetical protein